MASDSNGLTPKQEAFACAYVETGNASEAYRRAYDAARMKPEAIAVKPSKLLKDTKVTLRVEALQAIHSARHDVTVDRLTNELEEARELAMFSGAPAAAVSAIMGKAKLHGFLVEKIRQEGPRDISELTNAELEAIIRGQLTDDQRQMLADQEA